LTKKNRDEVPRIVVEVFRLLCQIDITNTALK
jgi:hypothetical protein